MHTYLFKPSITVPKPHPNPSKFRVKNYPIERYHSNRIKKKELSKKEKPDRKKDKLKFARTHYESYCWLSLFRSISLATFKCTSLSRRLFICFASLARIYTHTRQSICSLSRRAEFREIIISSVYPQPIDILSFSNARFHLVIERLFRTRDVIEMSTR